MSDDGGRLDELEIKIAFQDQTIRDLDALVRALGTRLDEALREIKQLKAAISSPEVPLGAPTEKPPHY